MMSKYIAAAILFISCNANAVTYIEEEVLNDPAKQWILAVSKDAETDGVGIAEFDSEDKCMMSLLVVEVMANPEGQKAQSLYAKCWKKTDSTRNPNYIISKHGREK